jgi:hypothetical protein
MGFNSLVLKQVRQAFRTAGDLKRTAIFFNKPVSAFDFAQGKAVEGVQWELPVSGIAGNRMNRRSKDGAKIHVMEFMFPSEGAPSLDAFDSANLGGESWKVSEVKNDGFVTTVMLVKEVSSG